MESYAQASLAASESKDKPVAGTLMARKQQAWVPFVLTIPFLIFMLLFAAAIFAGLEVAFQTIDAVHNGATVNLTTSNQPCQLSWSQLYNYEENAYTCPTNSNFEAWGGYCCCQNCTVTETPYIYDNWSSIPGLPQGAIHSSLPSENVEWVGASTTWFMITYLPTMVAIVYSLCWNAIDVNIKKLHPFMEMAHADLYSHTTGRVIDFTYLDKNTFLVPFYALWHRHFIVFASSLLDVASSLLVPLLTGCFQIEVFMLVVDGGIAFGQFPALNHIITRITEVYLLLMAVGIVVFMYLLEKKSSSVYCDPTSLASVVAMAHPSLLRAFRGFEIGTSADISSEELNARMEAMRPRLHHITDEVTGRTTYQISVDTTTIDTLQHFPPSRSNRLLEWFKKSNVPNLLLIPALMFGLMFTALWLGPSLKYASSSKQRGISLALVTGAVILKTIWVAIEREIRLLEPLRRLSTKRALKTGKPPNHTLLPPLEANLISAIYNWARRYDLLLVLFGLGGLIAEVVTALMSETLTSDVLVWVNTNGTTMQLPDNKLQNSNPTPSVARTVVVPMLVYVWFPIYFFLVVYRISAPRIPKGREVRTVVDVLRLFCGSHCVNDFAEVSMMKEKERNKVILGWERKYAFGVVRGVDSVARYGIDEAYLVRRIRPRRSVIGAWFGSIFRRDKGFERLEDREEPESQYETTIEMESSASIANARSEQNIGKPSSTPAVEGT